MLDEVEAQQQTPTLRCPPTKPHYGTADTPGCGPITPLQAEEDDTLFGDEKEERGTRDE